MARPLIPSIPSSISWTCRSCQHLPLRTRTQWRSISTSKPSWEQKEVRAAPEIDLSSEQAVPARILPVSPSYFTAAPVFNDNILRLERILKKYENLPQSPPEQATKGTWLTLAQYRSSIGEKVAASKYAKVTRLLTRLNKILPSLQPTEVKRVLREHMRPSAHQVQEAKPGRIDHYGRAKGKGTRKEAHARVFLVEGTGEVLVNGKALADVFPRIHDRESALWALKITERMDKYNVFAQAWGGGVTGQAESITLALAKALLVHEPALKPALRRAGCVTTDARRVERKKPGRLKARKKPAWVKR